MESVLYNRVLPPRERPHIHQMMGLHYVGIELRELYRMLVAAARWKEPMDPTEKLIRKKENFFFIFSYMFGILKLEDNMIRKRKKRKN